jgi:hypothetical protein
LQVAGCYGAPAATYEFRVSLDGTEVLYDPPLIYEPLIMPTSHDPRGDAQHWGDVNSDPGTSIPWMPPDGATGFGDISSVIKTFEDTGGPPLEWTDLEIDHVVSFGDIGFAIKAFEGYTYPAITDIVGGCPAEEPRALIGHEPCECPPGP